MNQYSVFPLVSALLFLLFGIIVLLKSKEEPAVRTAFLLNCLATFWWQFSWFILFNVKSSAAASILVKVGYSGIIFLPVTFFHFYISFLNKNRRWVNICYFIGFTFLIILWASNAYINNYYSYFWGYYPKAGFLHPVYLAYLTAIVIYCLYILFSAGKELGWKGARANQIKYLFIAFFIYCFASSDFLVNYGIKFYPVGFIFIMISLGIIAYTILKHHLLDIRIAITRAVIFVITYTFLLGIPFVLGIGFKNWLMAVFGPIWWITPLILMAILATTGPYLYIYIDRRAEEKMFRELRRQQETLKDYKVKLEDAAKSMILVREPDILIKMIVRNIAHRVGVSHAGILLHDKNRDSYILTVSRGATGLKIPVGFARMDADNALIRFFRERGDRQAHIEGVLIYSEVKKLLAGKNIETGLRELLEGALYQMGIFETVACVPAYFRDELLGVLLLGRKNNAEEFGRDELDFFVALASDVAMAIRNAQLFKDLELELDKNKRLFIHTTIALAAAIDAKDHYTHGHTSRVTSLSLEIAKKLMQMNKKAFDEKFLERLHIAGLLHDIGKIGIPESILNKEGALNDEERRRMQEHSTVGATILHPIKELEDAILGVKYHHEKYDGSGYPEGLKGDKIPLIAAIISVADTYDAMITDRSYRRGLSKSEAVEEIKRFSGKQFEPQIASAFIELYQEGKV